MKQTPDSWIERHSYDEPEPPCPSCERPADRCGCKPCPVCGSQPYSCQCMVCDNCEKPWPAEMLWLTGLCIVCQAERKASQQLTYPLSRWPMAYHIDPTFIQQRFEKRGLVGW